MSNLVAFSGSRRLSSAQAAVVHSVAPVFVPAGASVLVGCAGGVDAVVRSLWPQARLFSLASGAFGSGPGAFVRRSVSVVGALGSGQLVAFPVGPCPSGVVPASAWRSGRPSSGTWSTAALAAGRGASLVVVPLSGAALPAWPGGSWAESSAVAVAWSWIPSATQLLLLDPQSNR